MRNLFLSTTAVIALSALLGFAGAAQAQEQSAPPSQAPGVTEQVTKPGETAAQPEKKTPLATPEHQRQADEALNSTPGRAGKAEPGAQTKTPDPRLSGPVFVNGALNVPGAPEDSQTVPAKFSERNDRIDKLPTMAMPIGLSDAQKQSIVAAVRRANTPISKSDAKVTDQLPSSLALHDLPQDADRPGVKYLRLADRILLVRIPTNIVVDEIVNQPARPKN